MPVSPPVPLAFIQSIFPKILQIGEQDAVYNEIQAARLMPARVCDAARDDSLFTDHCIGSIHWPV